MHLVKALVLYSLRSKMVIPESYGSRTLNNEKRKYLAYRREFACLFGLFLPYLYGHKFHMVTDSAHFTYLVKSVKLSATDHRRRSSLASFDFTITYRAKKFHSDAYGLSSIPQSTSLGAGSVPGEDNPKSFLDRLFNSTEEALYVCPSEAFQANCQYHHVLQRFYANVVPTLAIEAISMSSREVATIAAANADPRQRVQRLEHPNADLLANVDSDKGMG